MIDRGADLSWLSQYPHEREVLLPPLTLVIFLTPSPRPLLLHMLDILLRLLLLILLLLLVTATITTSVTSYYY